MDVIALGTLLDNASYDIDLDEIGCLLTENTNWCKIALDKDSNKLQINLGTVKECRCHYFEILFEHKKKTYSFFGLPNLYN